MEDVLVLSNEFAQMLHEQAMLREEVAQLQQQVQACRLDLDATKQEVLTQLTLMNQSIQQVINTVLSFHPVA